MDTPERSNVMVQQSKVSFVSIIIPCRNEEKFIAKCLDSIINNDYTKERLEVLLVNGMSEDKTR
jgi:glycosyltransferase involved in cell wall biosynthesis